MQSPLLAHELLDPDLVLEPLLAVDFDACAGTEPDPGDPTWGYVVDEAPNAVVYGPGAWPFFDPVHKQSRFQTGARMAGPCSVRLSPDTEFRAWRNGYVLASESEVSFKHQLGNEAPRRTISVFAKFSPDLRRVVYLATHPDHLVGVIAKLEKIATFFALSIRERDQGLKGPTRFAHPEMRQAPPAAFRPVSQRRLGRSAPRV